MDESDKPSSELAVELGIRSNLLYKWKQYLENKKSEAFPNKLRQPLNVNKNEIVSLRQENDRLREELEMGEVSNSNGTYLIAYFVRINNLQYKKI